MAKKRVTKKGVHLRHCNQGENLGICKYGEKNCPALKRKEIKKLDAFDIWFSDQFGGFPQDDVWCGEQNMKLMELEKSVLRLKYVISNNERLQHQYNACQSMKNKLSPKEGK